jgi:hypothetical protein
MKPVICLVGHAGAGKDTVAQILCSVYGLRNVALSTPLKLVCTIIYGLSVEQLSDPQLKEVEDPRWEKSPRRLMQLTGTEALREVVDDHVWIKAARLAIDRELAHAACHGVVVTDCRFQNEVDFFKKTYGDACKVVKIERPGITQSAHASEAEIDTMKNVNHWIVNNSSISDLHAKTKALVEEMSSPLAPLPEPCPQNYRSLAQMLGWE